MPKSRKFEKVYTDIHKARQSISLPIGVDRLPLDTPIQVEVPSNGCSFCGKVFANKKKLESRMLKIHVQVTNTSAVLDIHETTGSSLCHNPNSTSTQPQLNSTELGFI